MILVVMGLLILSCLGRGFVSRIGTSVMRGGGCKVAGGVKDFKPVAQNRLDVRMMASVATEIKVIKDGCLSEKDVKTMSAWPVWGCEPSKFPWSYGEKETCLVIKGKAVVTPDDSSLATVTIEKGDVAIFPAGMSCTWDVTEEISKHYRFG
tara:strand:- start:198 stop:650 length:453 start_codon:yes stop_codon:yes gene_type:complete